MIHTTSERLKPVLERIENHIRPSFENRRYKKIIGLINEFSERNYFDSSFDSSSLYQNLNGAYQSYKNHPEIKEVFGDIEVVICRELTKMHEETRREKISACIQNFLENTPKGEFILLL